MSAIIAHFQSEHGLKLDHKQVGRYDPQRSYYAGGEKWREIFNARRKAYLEEVFSVPIAHQGYRMNVLQGRLDKALADDKGAEILTILEQAAKEVGGIFSKQRELRVDDNWRSRARDMTPEDRRAAMAEIIRQALENRGTKGRLSQLVRD